MPDVAVVPSLSPVEHEERILDPEYVRSQMSGRLASRHFRNHLYILAGTVLPDTGENELTNFVSWAEPWLPGLVVSDLVTRQGEKGRLLDLFCKEHGSHTDRELFGSAMACRSGSSFLRICTVPKITTRSSWMSPIYICMPIFSVA